MQLVTQRAFTLPLCGTVSRLDVGIPFSGLSFLYFSLAQCVATEAGFSHLRLALFGWLSVSLLFS